MIRLLHMFINGFRSFASEQKFHFPQAPGLYFMRGENRKEPRLGANGAGKSTVWEALCWVLFGKTSRGLKAGDTGQWGSKRGTSVHLVFESDITGTRTLYCVKRTWKPNSWVLVNMSADNSTDLTKDGTNPLLAMLRLQFEPFLHSVFMSQRGDMFLDLKPEPKAQLFSSVMDLDKWLQYVSAASASAEAQDKQSRKLESEQASLRGQLEASGTEDLEASADEFERKRKTKLAQIGDDYAKALKRAEQAKLRANLALSDADKVCGDAAHVFKNCDEAEAEERFALRQLRAAEDTLIGLQRDLDHAEKHNTAVQRGEGCPTCGRPFNSREQAELEVQADELYGEARVAANQAQKVVNDLRQEWERINKLLQEIRRCRDEVQCLEDDANAEVRNARRDHELEERKLDQLEEEAERLEQEKNPFADMLETNQERLQRARDKHHQVSAQLDRSHEKYALYSFWVRGFKEVRLQLIAEALEQLEIEVNNELTALGLINWELHFDVDSETKKGTLSRGFSVSVLSPHNDERVPWEAWSGGESQRLRLAAQCGLANLIRDRTGCELGLEVWDEPTEGLSEEGITDLMNALKERAIREGRTIWVVDHRSLGYGGFDGTVTVVKDDKGSRLIQSTV